MEAVFIVFMTFVSVVCLFSVLVVTRDIVKDHLESRREKRVEQPVAPVAPVTATPAPVAAPVAVAVAPEPVAVPTEEPVAPAKPEPVEDPVVCEVAEEAAVAEENTDGSVSFSADKGQTLDDKYHALTSENKNYFDEIIKYASAVEGSKRFKNMRYEEYKIGSSRIVRLTIKRGIVHCEFMMQNTSFKNYVTENKISVRQSATVIKVTSDEVVQTIKDTIDIVVKAIGEEREFKKQLAKEKRRARRAEQNN